MAVTTRDRGTFETLDDAFHLLRELPFSAWVIYFLGAVPFLLALLWTATELTILYTPVNGLENSFVCALTFVWMQFWRVRFAAFLETQLRRTPSEPWTSSRVLRSVSLQAAIQPAKLVLLPLAAITVLPFAWLTTFFRTITVLLSRPLLSLRELERQAARLSSPNPRLTWLVLAILFAVGFFLFINMGILLLILPSLVKSFTGSENQFTRGTGNALNWRLIQTAFGFTWLSIDPLIQAVAVCRIYAIEATTTGADLLASFRRAALVVALVACTAGAVRADVPPPVLQQNVNRVLQERQYSWQAQRDPGRNAPFGLVDKLARALKDGIRKIGDAISVFFDWLRRAFTSDQGESSDSKTKKAPASVRWVVSALACVIAVALIVFFVRGRRIELVPQAELTVAAIDLEDDSVTAADLPEDGWLRMAHDSAGRGDYRLALRALFLATLAHLGSRQLLTLANTKTNRDYQRELRRRSQSEPLQQSFRQSVQNFESAWYGRHETGETQISQYRLTFDAVRSNAE